MARVVTLALVVMLSAWTVRRLDGQGLPPTQPTPVRDPAAPLGRGQSQPSVRRVAIGTGVITGVVTAADTGRPMRNARVSLNSMSTPASGIIAGVSGPAPSPTQFVVTGGVTITSGGLSQTSVAYSPSSLSRTVITDAQGQFTFSRLAAGQYSLSVNRNQYLTTNYGQKKPSGPGTTIQLADGQQIKIPLQLIRGGVITGQVLGEDGDPISGAQVRGSRYTMTNGIRRVQTSGYASTDDRGVYRLFGLQPGDYILSATPNQSDTLLSDRMNADMAAIEQAIASGTVQPGAAPGMPATVAIPTPAPVIGPVTQPPGYLPIYYPGTPIASRATIIRIAGGDERVGVDVQVQLVQASNIEGSISNPPPQGLAIQLNLLSDDPANANDAGSPPSARAAADGKFTFRTVAPGKYVVFAQTVVAPRPVEIINGVRSGPTPAPPRLDDSQRWWALAAVTVEGQTTVATNLTLQPGRSISGIVLFDMVKPPDLTQARLMVNLSSAPASQSISIGQPPQAQVGPDGRFTLNGVIPGKYILRAPGGVAKSSIVNGQDTLDFPLDFTGERDVTDAVLTVTDKSNELSGTLTDAMGRPATDLTIVLASSDERFWTPSSRRVVTARTGADGRYTFRNLPPGTYLLAAVNDLESGAQYDPEFLRTLNGAALHVTLAEGAKQAQDFRVR